MQFRLMRFVYTLADNFIPCVIFQLKCLELVSESKIAFTELEAKVGKLDQFGAEQNSLILAVEKTVSEKLDDVSGEVRENAKTFKEKIQNISKLF